MRTSVLVHCTTFFSITQSAEEPKTGGKSVGTPDGKKPISKWTPRDDGFENIVAGLAKIVKLWNEQTLPDSTPERKALMADLVHLIETVKTQLQPPQRALATAKTLQQLSILIPNGVTLADLVTNPGCYATIEGRCGERIFSLISFPVQFYHYFGLWRGA